MKLAIIDNNYKVGDIVFVHHKMNGKVVTSIGFLVYTANRDSTILARTINPLSDLITISDDDFICLGHIEDLEKPNISTLSSLERAGVSKGERKSPSPYRQIGTVTEPKSRLENIEVDNPLFGKIIGRGGQLTVFENTSNPDKVLKVVTDRKFTSIPEIRLFHKEWMKRNRLPLLERIDFQGYLQGEGRIYPVYELNKVSPLGDMSMVRWEREYIPQINSQMQKLGYNGNGTYTNGTLNVGDINPWNIGYNKNGTLRFFDADIYKFGGRVIFRNK